MKKRPKKRRENDATYGNTIQVVFQSSKGTIMKLFRIIFATSNDCNYFDQ